MKSFALKYCGDYLKYGMGIKVYIAEMFIYLMVCNGEFWTRVQIELEREISMNKWINKDSTLINH